MARGIEEFVFRIPSFKAGINNYETEALIKPYEALHSRNADITSGALETMNVPTIYKSINAPSNLTSIGAYYSKTSSEIFYNKGTKLYFNDIEKYTFSGNRLDFLNFEYKGERVAVFTSKDDTPFIYNGSTCRKLKNRRKNIKEDGTQDGWLDANGTKHTNESTITTYAPSGDFMELHYDRLWIAGDKDNPDRVYFSTAGVDGADLEDFTAPTDEVQANMHGGFIDVRSYDGGKIIGLKVVFNSVVIFKNTTAYKVFGNNPSNYQLVQLFSSNGAIADKSICVGNNGAYFLNSDGIYYYDGTNTTLISQKLGDFFKGLNSDYVSKSVGYFHQGKYYLAVPHNSTENNILIEHDIVNKSFMLHEIGNIRNFLDYSNQLLFSNGTNILKVRDTDKTLPQLPLVWRGATSDFQAKNSRKLSNYIYFRAKGNGKVKITLKSERTQKILLIDLDSTDKLYRKKIKVKGRLMQLEFSNYNNSYFQLTSPEIFYEIDAD